MRVGNVYRVKCNEVIYCIRVDTFFFEGRVILLIPYSMLHLLEIAEVDRLSSTM